jgi:transcriptional regulator with XRE-family HTH domain
MKEKTEEIRQILAKNIKKRRKILGISQEKLAETANLSVSTLNTIELCRMWVSDKTITKIAKALNVEVFQLLVPYYADKQELDMSSASVLLEVKEKITNELDRVNTYVDFMCNEALKNNPQKNTEPQPKPRRGK